MEIPYDPNRPLPVAVWPTLDEDERLARIEAHHASPQCDHAPAPNPELHATVHLIVENQVALGDATPTAAAIARLCAEGLTRHEAVHAVGSIIAEDLFAVMRDAPGAPPDRAGSADAIRGLTAASWRARSAAPQATGSTAWLALTAADVARFDDAALIALLHSEEDRVPRAVVDEIVVRRERLTGALIAILMDAQAWDRPLPAWWAPLHATFILGAIGKPSADAALLHALREADARNNDWILEVMPAILGRRGTPLVARLTALIADARESIWVRRTAVSALAGVAAHEPGARAAVLERLRAYLADGDQDTDVRTAAAHALLDLRDESSRAALLAFARDVLEPTRDVYGVVEFDANDVERALSGPPPQSPAYLRDWLSFYSAAEIARRQRRWAEEEARRQPVEPRIRVGRNDPCPCGSGKKFKKCCGR